MTHPHPLNQHQTPNAKHQTKPNQHNTTLNPSPTRHHTQPTTPSSEIWIVPHQKATESLPTLVYQLRHRGEVGHSCCCFQCFQCTAMQTNLTCLPSTAATRNLPKEFRNPGGGQAAGDWIWWPKPNVHKKPNSSLPRFRLEGAADGRWRMMTGRDATRRDRSGCGCGCVCGWSRRGCGTARRGVFRETLDGGFPGEGQVSYNLHKS